MPACDVRPIESTDEPAWRRMWSANCAHFGASPSRAADDELWRRMVDAAQSVRALIAHMPGSEGAAGFAHYVLHPHTFSERTVCYLEDLWVEPFARGAGVGRCLIDYLVARGKELGWRRVYWHTDADNVAARALYDRVARLTNHVRYDIELP